MNTIESLIADIKKIGVKKNDTIFVRISYRAVGKTDGGPKTVIDSLLSVIGTGGTLIATAFPQRIPARKKKEFKDTFYTKGMKPTTGVIPVIMSQYPEACYSSHPISPYVAIGANAKEITDIHTPETESYDVVKLMIEKYDCKCLRIGGDVLDGTTHLAFTEGLRNTNSFQYRMAEGNYYYDSDGEKKWLEKSVSAFCYAGFKKYFFEQVYHYPGAIIGEGTIGEGKAMLSSMRKTLEAERQYIAKDPKVLLCNNPKCAMCRTSFTYSKQSVISYALHQTTDLLTPKTFKETVHRIKLAYMDRYYGTKCQ